LQFQSLQLVGIHNNNATMQAEYFYCSD